jgi:hypothetical protein
MDGPRRLAWLEDYAASVAASGDLPVPFHFAHRNLKIANGGASGRRQPCNCGGRTAALWTNPKINFAL